MKSNDLLKYLSKQQVRGFLIEHNLHPDKEHIFKSPEKVEEIEDCFTHSSWPYYYEIIADKWDKGEHPTSWKGACHRCWIEKKEEIYHDK